MAQKQAITKLSHIDEAISDSKKPLAQKAEQAMPVNEFVENERKWQAAWEKSKIYAFDFKSKAPVFSIDTPPPTVSGRMHLGHAFSYSQADFIARYKRMKGFNVFYPFGLDDNGLATERLVEKSRKIRAKDFTREEFIKICLEETRKHEDVMISDFRSLGLSLDWGTLYRTIEPLARKISQRSFLDIYKSGRAYRKEAPSMWCPSCETAIAQAELEDVEMDSTFNDLVFMVKDGKGQLTVSTTRPEMLPSCVAIFIHPSDKRKKELLGKKAVVPIFGQEVPILEDARVDPEKGTGIVMCCTFGDQTDMEWYFAYNLPLRISFTKDGRMTELAGKYGGMKIRDARKEIIKDLGEAGTLVSQKQVRHSVKVHERCKTEMEIMNAKQWFIKYLDLKEEFLKKGRELKWHPEHMRVRYENWINGLQWDWSLSRQRFYGVPFPLWYCAKCNSEIPADEKQLPVDPLQDSPAAKKCPKCGATEFTPEKDVLDTWATSSLTPQINSQWGVDEGRHKKLFPMSLRPQAHDIITLWTFNTIVKAYLHEKKLPWKDIMISGHALDPKGRKMSKSLGNSVSPVEMVEKYSADMLRYWAATGTLGDDLPLQEKEFLSGKKFLTKLSNASRFAAMKAKGMKLDSFEKHRNSLRTADKWILSRLERAKKEATDSLEAYEYSKALAALRSFFWLEFADFYIEMVKHRTPEEKPGEGTEARATLLKVTTELLKMLSPFVPHASEEIFQSNFKSCAEKESVHLERWPEADGKLVDAEAEAAGELAKKIIAGLRKHKTANNMAMNAELAEAEVFIENGADLKRFGEISEDVKETMKVKVLALGKGKPATGFENGVALEMH
ncbi:Isoleucine--tRNA ligase [uncultured archaeon]|nr:Isoleucine--tRNA ligase [uncultured archaeon]